MRRRKKKRKTEVVITKAAADGPSLYRDAYKEWTLKDGTIVREWYSSGNVLPNEIRTDQH